MKIRKIKIIVDILMFCILIYEMIPVSIVPVSAHCIGGVLFAALYIIHILLNGKWCVSVMKTFFKKKINPVVKRLYFTDWLLLIIWSIVTLSGSLAMDYSMEKVEGLIIFRHIHYAFAIVGCVITVIHIYQHRKQISSYMKKKKA